MGCLTTGCLRAAASVSLVLVTLTIAGPTMAQTHIGSAISVVREVSGVLGNRTMPVKPDDGVFANENIRTGQASTAKLQFLDRSRLTIGPAASVILDRFVYNQNRSVRQAAVRFAIGAARWTDGALRSHAYKFFTPQAIIGVRGTAFDLLVEGDQTVVTLRRGAIVVCLVSAPQHCVTVTVPRQTVIVSADKIQGPIRGGPSSTQFAANCLSAHGGTGQCATYAFSNTRFAALRNNAIDAFLANPAETLQQYPNGGPHVISLIRDVAVGDPKVLDKIIGLLSKANQRQQIAIGSGLGQAAQMVVKNDPNYATQIQGALIAACLKATAKMQCGPAVVAFASVTGNTDIAAIGGGGGGVGGGGINGSLPIGGLNSNGTAPGSFHYQTLGTNPFTGGGVLGNRRVSPY